MENTPKEALHEEDQVTKTLLDSRSNIEACLGEELKSTMDIASTGRLELSCDTSNEKMPQEALDPQRSAGIFLDGPTQSTSSLREGEVHTVHRDSESWLELSLMFVSPSLLAIFLSLLTGFATAYNAFQTNKPHGCDPGGQVWISGAKERRMLSIWNPEFFLSITVPYGKFSFSQAKAIDICWDLVVSRGLQALSAVYLYWVFRAIFTDALRHCSLPQAQVLAVEYSTTSPWSLWIYMKIFMNRRGPKRLPPVVRFKMLVLIVSTIYVLAVPTWVSAMTGYQALGVPLLSANDSFTELDTLERCKVSILDGHRIGLTDNYCVPLKGPLSDEVQTYLESEPCLSCYPRLESHWQNLNLDYELDEYHTYVPFNEAFRSRVKCDMQSDITIDGKRHHLSGEILEIEGGAYNYHNTTLSSAYLLSNSNTLCNQVDRYEWGFSFLLLFTFYLTTVPLAFTLLLMWYRTNERLWPAQTNLIFGDLRTALVVAESIHDGLDNGIGDLSNDQIKRRLSTHSSGVRREHARSDIMFTLGPHQTTRKSPLRFPVGSEAYEARLNDWSANRRPPRTGQEPYDRCMALTPSPVSTSNVSRKTV